MGARAVHTSIGRVEHAPTQEHPQPTQLSPALHATRSIVILDTILLPVPVVDHDADRLPPNMTSLLYPIRAKVRYDRATLPNT